MSFYARSHLGQKNFRLLHYTSFLVFVMVTVHGLYSGTDSLPLWWLYALSLVSVVVLTGMRILNTRPGKKTGGSSDASPRAAGGKLQPATGQSRPAKARCVIQRWEHTALEDGEREPTLMKSVVQDYTQSGGAYGDASTLSSNLT